MASSPSRTLRNWPSLQPNKLDKIKNFQFEIRSGSYLAFRQMQ